GERPALHVELFELVAIALDHDVFVLAHPLDLAERRLELEDLEIVQGAERDDEIERFVVERVALLCAVAKELVLHVPMRIGEPMVRDVEADELGLGQQQLELAQQIALAAADVEDAPLPLETVQLDERLRDRLPAALDVAISAVAVAPV